MLNAIDYDSGGPAGPVLIAHGLFGSARNWGAVSKRMSDRGPVRSVDMRNHGTSTWSDDMTYTAMGQDLIASAAELGGQIDLIGHSMGGKAAMVAALQQPSAFRRLVVLDIAPVGYTHSHAHLIAAMRALDLTPLSTRPQADAALAQHVADPTIRAFLLQSLDLKSDPPAWRLNLEVLDRAMGDLVGFPTVQGVFQGPALFLSGDQSDYVLPTHRDQIRALFPRARFAKIKGAGHWLHAEKPREVEATLRAFLDA